MLLALLLGWTGARVTSLGGEGAASLPGTMLTVGTAVAAAPVEPQGGRHFAGPQSYAASGYGPMPLAYQPVQFVPVWMGNGPHGALVPPAYLASRAAEDPGGGEPPQELALFNAASRSTSRLPSWPESESVPAPFTGSAYPARYGEPATLLGGRLGRLIGDPAHWSMDAWALVRKSGTTPLPSGILPATYGARQAGAVLRYRFALQDAHRATAYLRTTSSPGPLNETSAALGLSARPLPSLPIVVGVEGRITDSAGGRRVQPAALAVTEIPPMALPGSLRAEIYGQAGYVAGRFATPFADGQVRVDRTLVRLGDYEARVGAGAWGGVQTGASRLDVGPGATISGPLTSKVFGRLALDWRLRAAGDAEPDSGPALTVAAGF